ncbi:peptidoglycan-binding protein [Marivivens sp. LCG002]|uniref:peptidoglycan-binding protein n=1 Tax=Marivivens sp. LCG002 TaxID=3051171 RepID=UPI0025534AC4|nr:peptidoglycan-binding protein [Marivivens sp. LCG002]WIV50608.1 peptidoglycan-binding protein [Marivivens sp. LCG002]
MRRFLIGSALATVLAGSAFAEDAALLFGNDSYDRLGRVSRGAEILGSATLLEDLGFDVVSIRNGDAQEAIDKLDDFVALVPDSDRLVVALTGRFATDGERTWMLSSDAENVGILTVGFKGLSIESLLAVLAEKPGSAFLLLGADQLDGAEFDEWVRNGVGAFAVPQGVTVAIGSVRDISAFMRTEVAKPARDLSAALAATSSIKVQGFLPKPWVLMPTISEPSDTYDTAGESALWDGAVALDTVDAYRNYIRRYPQGAHRKEADAAIQAILSEPNRGARLAEEALSLTRNQRREIQRDLTILDYNTRGIDGIFGPGTRGAITNWQQVNGYAQTSYLTTEQINRLDAQASRRAAELEAEAERKRQEQARLDRTYWEETGAKADEAGYRAYLERFPDGIFSEVARDRLTEIEQSKRALAEVEDRATWERVRASDTVSGYQDYLSAYPEGVFVAEAQARIAELTRSDQAQTQYLASEQSLGLNLITLQLIEARLEQLGLEPGRVDGALDEDSRRAIRRYQQARGLPESGYVNDMTLVRLLADFTGIGGR